MAGVEKNIEDYKKLSEPEKREKLREYAASGRSWLGSKNCPPGAVKYSPFCGCCPVGLIFYPKSIEEVLDTDCHSEFFDNFEMFLRKKKDENTASNWHYKLKHQQRLDFACMTSVIKREDKSAASFPLGEVGRRFYSQAGSDHPDLEWVADLLTGFTRAKALIGHLKEIFEDSRKALKKDLVVAANGWVVQQLDINLKEYIDFRDGLDEEEREKWDKMVKKENKERSKEEGCDDSSEEEGITKEDWLMQKEMEDRVRLMLENMFPGSMVGGSHSGMMLSIKCWYCQKESGQLLKCSRCLNAVYCDDKCQLRDWDAHKEYCNKVKKERKQKKREEDRT